MGEGVGDGGGEEGGEEGVDDGAGGLARADRVGSAVGGFVGASVVHAASSIPAVSAADAARSPRAMPSNVPAACGPGHSPCQPTCAGHRVDTECEGGTVRRGVRAATAVAATLVLGGCVQIATTPESRPPSGAVDTATPGEGAQGGRQGGGDGYRFMHTRDNGRPVRWSTCEPIEYVVRPANEPDGARELLEESIDRISEVTGLEFSFDRTTQEGPSNNRQPYQPKRYGERWAPVLITYAGGDEYPRLDGRAAGFAGPTYIEHSGVAPRYVSGMVVLDADQLSSMGEDGMRAVMLHELAHVVGLAHIQDRGQLMNPVQYGRGVTDLQEGDLEGLRAVGDGRCYEPIRPQRFGG